MNEPISVEARFNQDGSLLPIAFEWKGQRYSILSYGRQWEQEAERHFLVMVQGEKVYELAYLIEEVSWRLIRSPRGFGHPATV